MPELVQYGVFADENTGFGRFACHKRERGRQHYSAAAVHVPAQIPGRISGNLPEHGFLDRIERNRRRCRQLRSRQGVRRSFRRLRSKVPLLRRLWRIASRLAPPPRPHLRRRNEPELYAWRDLQRRISAHAAGGRRSGLANVERCRAQTTDKKNARWSGGCPARARASSHNHGVT